MTSLAIRPCLCGHAPRLAYQQDRIWSPLIYRVECPECELATSWLGNKFIVIETWNRMERPDYKKGKAMEQATVTAKLPFHLTDAEAATVAERATQLGNQQDNMEEEYALVKREWNQKIKKIKLESRTARQVHASRIEEREVECLHCYDLKAGRCWYEFDEERYLERDITEEEREMVSQGTIFGDGANIPD